MDSSRIYKVSNVALALILCLLPILGYWAIHVRYGTALVEEWLPENDQVVASYHRFVEHFGHDQFLLISWPDCDLEDARLPIFAEQLSALRQQHPEYRILTVNHSLQAVEQLTNSPLNFTEPEAIERLQGIALGKNLTCFVTLQLGFAPAEMRTQLLDAIAAIAVAEFNFSPEELILAGEPLQVSIIDRASRETMQSYVWPSSLLALLVAWRCLRSVRLTLLVFAFAGIGQLLGLALISVWLGEMSAVLVVLPTLVFMLTLSAAVHLTHYFMDAGGEQSHTSGADALRIGAMPCVLATLTTLFGFGSLVVSQLAPVWQFGLLAAIGLGCSTTVLLFAFPAGSSLSAWAYRGLGRLHAGSGSGISAKAESAPASHNRLHEGLPPQPPPLRPMDARFSTFIFQSTQRYSTPISLVGIGLLVIALLGIPRLRTSTEFTDMFPANSRAVKSLRWVEENIGPINVLEFLLDFPGTAAVALPDQVQLLANLHTALQQSPHVDSVWSTATFLPLAMLKQGAEPFDLEAKGIRSTIRRAVLRKKLEEMLPVLQAAQLVHLSDAGQTWRLSIRVRDMNGENFNAIRKEMVERGLAILLAGEPPAVVPTVDAAEINSWELPACDLTVTGLRTVVERAHHALLSDLGISFMTAFVLITPVMMLIVRGVLAGCLLMIPNILPVAMVFGGMGWWGVQLDVASILTASVALGIAVDDTLHFISWYVRGRRAGKEPSAAVQVAISACWRPMLHTTLICTGAMLPFFFSDFLPTSKFALLMILILSGAILGDLILLPALLQGPLGKWIGKKREIASG